MAGTRKEPTDEGMVSRLAGRGEEALTRLVDELGRNERVTDALGRAMAAKGRVDENTRKTLGTIGLTSSEDLKELSKRLERLEKRVQKLEGGSRSTSARARKTTSSSSTRKRTPPRRNPSS
jgi:polyhydroxyalkanoate synthesis regulator phasin